MTDDNRKQPRSIIQSLKEFREKLEAGIPIEATSVTVEQTPDGPLTTRKHVVLTGKNKST